MDSSNKVEVNEAFIAEWLKHKFVWNAKARAYKNSNARENALRNLTKIFEIIWNYST